MGMYSEVIENKNLNILEEDKVDKYFLGFLYGSDSIKFYGYWDDEYFKELKMYGVMGILEGEIIFRYEEGDVFSCIWSKDGFKYSKAKFVFDKYTEA